jgi:transcriptional regulator NrdR family protein
MHSSHYCPRCDQGDSEVVDTRFGDDAAEQLRVCNDCPTSWLVTYTDPTVGEVIHDA